MPCVSAKLSSLCRVHICPLQGQSKYFPILFWFYEHFPSSTYASTLSQHLWILSDFLLFYFIFYCLQLSLLLEANLSILIPFDARFANTFPRVMPGVEIVAVYEIIVSHTTEQGICALNCAIPAFPPQWLTVTEGVSLPLHFNNNFTYKKCR